MSNPVAPPPPPGDGYPPAHQGFGNAPAPSQPYGSPPPAGQTYGAPPAAGQTYGAPPMDGQPAPGQPVPGQPYGDPAQQGFGSAPEPKKKSKVGRVVLRILGAIVVFVIIAVARDAFFGDKAKDAAVGDCVASSANVQVDKQTEAKAEVVDCSSADAKFTVVGRVDGDSNTQSKACEKFFKENEEYFVYGSTAGKGYLLCLRPKAS